MFSSSEPFRFRFGEANEGDEQKHEESLQASSTSSVPTVNVDILAALAKSVETEESTWEVVHISDSIKFFKRRGMSVEALGIESDVLSKIDSDQSDLVPNIYEGGLKLWECAFDLVAFLEKNKIEYPLEGKRIVDLGCGHGLPGIYCLMERAHYVTFQDLNVEVLSHVTLPNSVRNLAATKPPLLNVESPHDVLSQQLSQMAMYVSGDWSSPSLCQTIGEESVDIILTSDTIYSENSISPLCDVITKLLKPSGYAIVAAKRFYFGVGGSTAQLHKIAKKYNLTSQSVKVIEDASSNIREIIVLHKTQ